ncbi:MAG: hypothetical protein ACI8Q1_001648 [Parvicella sp.]|jgi:hypothetical protein
MDYILSLDGPTHLYNANLFNELLLENNTFIQQHLSFNSEFTPNYVGLIWSAILLKLFSPILAIKVFYLSYILGLLLSVRYFIESFQEEKNQKWSIILILPFVYSYFVISGFINFHLAFIPMFLTAGYYIQQKELKIKNSALIAFGILLTYFSHSIVFGFLVILLGSLEFTKTILINRNTLALLKKGLLLVLLSIIPIILTFSFLGSRESEALYLDFWVLVDDLFQMKSMRMFNSQGTLIGYSFSTSLLIIVTALIVKSVRSTVSIQPKDGLLLAALLFLASYFILPDSVGFASVFSVRIEYAFWLCIVIWIILSLKNAYLSGLASVVSLAMIIWNVSIIKSELSELNSFGKKVASASEFIERNSIVYPIFASNEWNHLHFSNLLGLEKPLLILENGAARQDYFPIQYNEPYEDCINLNTNRTFSCGFEKLKIDYVIVLGSEWVAIDANREILNSITEKDSLVYENSFVKLYKLN